MQQVVSWLMLLCGVLLIGVGFFGPQIRRRLGLREWSSFFTVPALHRSAQLQERVGRITQVLLGIGFIFLGIGARYSPWPGLWFSMIGLVFDGAAMVGCLIWIGIVLAYRRPSL